jgi:hypothetical protein
VHGLHGNQRVVHDLPVVDLVKVLHVYFRARDGHGARDAHPLGHGLGDFLAHGRPRHGLVEVVGLAPLFGVGERPQRHRHGPLKDRVAVHGFAPLHDAVVAWARELRDLSSTMGDKLAIAHLKSTPIHAVLNDKVATSGNIEIV